jgi:hypothetical protein
LLDRDLDESESSKDLDLDEDYIPMLIPRKGSYRDQDVSGSDKDSDSDNNYIRFQEWDHGQILILMTRLDDADKDLSVKD